MEFYHARSLYRFMADTDAEVRKLKPDDFYTAFMRHILARGDGDKIAAQLYHEREWFRLGRPYYKVWPKIIPALTRLDLEAVPARSIKTPLPHLLLRFPHEHDLALEVDQRWPVRTILLSTIDLSKQPREFVHFYGSTEPTDLGIMLWIDVGETFDDGGHTVPSQFWRNFPLVEGQTVEEALHDITYVPREFDLMGLQAPDHFVRDCIRLACTLCLLESDPEIIAPVVLSKDADKFARTGDEKYVERAKRRGEFGWNVGRELSVSPHFRRAHPHLYWTGKGRTVPKINFVKSTMVHRELVTNIPTGYDDGSSLETHGRAAAARD